MLITKEIEIDMGHRIPNHKSKCATPHGHRYKVEVGVDDKVIDTEGVSDEGMVIDFGDLKEIMIEVIDKPYDHSGIFYDEDKKIEALRDLYSDTPKKAIFVHFIPTAENLAKHWYLLLKEELSKRSIKIKYVKVWETPTSTATYGEQD